METKLDGKKSRELKLTRCNQDHQSRVSQAVVSRWQKFEFAAPTSVAFTALRTLAGEFCMYSLSGRNSAGLTVRLRLSLTLATAKGYRDCMQCHYSGPGLS
jgi:hypothetical protein